ncbi:MAG: hypothetical protein WEC84_04760 [Candidatus Andersenbacteria bacterium]
MRLRRIQFSQEVRQSATTKPKKEVELTPNRKGIQLFKNRAAVIPHVVKNSTANTKQWWHDRKERKEAKAEAREQAVQEAVVKAEEKEQAAESGSVITEPRKGWRDRMTSWSEKSRGKLSGLKESVADTVPRRIRIGTPVAAVPPAAIKTRALDLEGDVEEVEGQGSSKIKLVRVRKKTEEQAIQEERKRKAKAVVPEPQAPAALSEQGPLGEAAEAIHAEQYEKAEDILVPYIVQHSREAKAYMLLGKAALGREAWEEAMEIFEQVLNIDDAQKGARAGLGHAALKIGKMTVALSSLQRAHDEDGGDPQVLQDLLTIAQRMDNKVLARSVKEDLAKIEFDAIREQAKEPVR